MTREEAQDAALEMCAQWRQVAKGIDVNRNYLMTGKQLKALCDCMVTITDSAARMAERIPMEILEGK